jgi:hypothetical protein
MKKTMTKNNEPKKKLNIILCQKLIVSQGICVYCNVPLAICASKINYPKIIITNHGFLQGSS